MQVSVSFDTTVTHDFSKLRCMVPGTISIQSCGETADLDIVWETFKPDEQDTRTDNSTKFTAPYMWVGVTRKTFGEKVEPGQQVVVKASISV